MPDKYEFATEYILQECGSLSWWRLSKKWKRIAASRIARIIVDEAIDSHLTKRAFDEGDSPAQMAGPTPEHLSTKEAETTTALRN